MQGFGAQDGHDRMPVDVRDELIEGFSGSCSYADGPRPEIVMISVSDDAIWDELAASGCRRGIPFDEHDYGR
jgi:hypothetical protein